MGKHKEREGRLVGYSGTSVAVYLHKPLLGLRRVSLEDVLQSVADPTLIHPHHRWLEQDLRHPTEERGRYEQGEEVATSRAGRRGRVMSPLT